MNKPLNFKKTYALALTLALVMFIGVVAASAEPWKFGVMSDTQWPNSPDNKNPNSVAVNVINHLNQEFINQGVKFVVAVGDVTDNGSILALDTRATFAQAFYNAGIGFYPLRGNHESSKTAAIEFQRIFPQTQTGLNNQTPLASFVTTTYYGAPPLNTNGTFTVGSNFASYPAANVGYNGLFYSFDYDNARFILMDQFTPTDGASHSVLDAAQVNWVGTQLQTRPDRTHAFVFGHKHLISENHADTLFGSNPSVNPDLQNTFMASLFNNGVRYYLGGHDHMHNRAIVTSPSGTSTVQNIITASNSYKFYIPQNPSNDAKYNIPVNGITNGPREMEISQELFNVGYYIVTVDGPRVTVDYYASPNGCNGDCDETYDVIPYTFTKHETFGYSLNGREFLVAQGQSYADVQDSHGSTTARILGGINGSTAADYAGRPFTKAVDTGWSHGRCDTASDILSLWGMADLGSDQTDVYALSLNYDHERVRPEHLGRGLFGLAAKDADGNWINAVDKNFGGTKKFVMGPWRPGYELGTYGVDPHTHTVWAVINHNSNFAVAQFEQEMRGNRDGDKWEKEHDRTEQEECRTERYKEQNEREKGMLKAASNLVRLPAIRR
jgi:hypothetical protein